MGFTPCVGCTRSHPVLTPEDNRSRHRTPRGRARCSRRPAPFPAPLGPARGFRPAAASPGARCRFPKLLPAASRSSRAPPGSGPSAPRPWRLAVGGAARQSRQGAGLPGLPPTGEAPGRGLFAYPSGSANPALPLARPAPRGRGLPRPPLRAPPSAPFSRRPPPRGGSGPASAGLGPAPGPPRSQRSSVATGSEPKQLSQHPRFGVLVTDNPYPN